jgi:hypothetical protein
MNVKADPSLWGKGVKNGILKAMFLFERKTY